MRLVLEIGSDCHLPESIITAVKEDMKDQCKNGWGQEIENINIPLEDVVFYDPDLSIGLTSDMQRQYPDYQFSKLNNPSLGVYVYDVEWDELR